MVRQAFPVSWGGHYTNKDYEPMMAGATAISRPISLVGETAMTGINQNLADPVTRRFTKKIGGRLVDREEVIRPAQQLSLTMTILFGNAFETPALARARLGTSCLTTMYAVNLCPADPRFGHAYIFPDGILNPPTRVNDLISINDTNTADWQSEFRVSEELVLRAIGAFRTKAAAVDLAAVAFLSEDCSSCDGSTIYSDAIAVGGDLTEDAEMLILKTSTRFSSSTAVTGLPSPIEVVGTSIYTRGDVVLVGFSDTAKPTFGSGAGSDPATGGTLFSNDGMATVPALDTNITVSIMGVGFYNGQYMAVGGAGLGASVVYVSDDGVSWTSVGASPLPAAHALTALAVDEVAGKFYVVSEDGKLLSGTENGGSIIYLDLTSRLPSSPTALWTVHVFGEDHIAVGGASGFYAESVDGALTFTSPAVPGATAINSITGTKHRALVGTAAKTYVRDVMTNMEYTLLEVQDGITITGNVVGLAQTDDLNLNHFLAVTADGEVMSDTHFSPYNV